MWGGSIDLSCTTTNGTFTVIWLSANPRPEREELGINDPQTVPFMGQKYGGRVTILAIAIAIGEGSLPDTNSGLAYSVSIKGTTIAKSGSLVIEVETPGGLKTTFSPVSIDITL